MNIVIGDSRENVINQAHQWFEQMAKQGHRSFYLPAGGTPNGLYKKWESEQYTWPKDLLFYQIDDILDGQKKGLFKKFFKDELPSYQSHIKFLDNGHFQASAGFLGIGVNGHVAFHEPGLANSFSYGSVKLSDKTKNYLELNDEKWGISYGLGAFNKCEKLLVMAMGTHKANVVNELLCGSSDLPVCELRNHPGLTLLLDEEAYSLYKKNKSKSA
jgi:glucosamine-6-phosphate deaminase